MVCSLTECQSMSLKSVARGRGRDTLVHGGIISTTPSKRLNLSIQEEDVIKAKMEVAWTS